MVNLVFSICHIYIFILDCSLNEYLLTLLFRKILILYSIFIICVLPQRMAISVGNLCYSLLTVYMVAGFKDIIYFLLGLLVF